MSLTDDDKKWMFESVVEPIRTDLCGVKADLLDLETKLCTEMRDMKTNLLTEFHKWAAPTEARLRTRSAMLRAIDLEMEAMSDRIGKLKGPGAS